MAREAHLPRLLQGTEHEVVDFTDSFANDVDYYIYELGRLQDLVQDEALIVFSVSNELRTNSSEPSRVAPRELGEALNDFLTAIPMLKETRNALTHLDDTIRMDDFGSFSAAVRFESDGGVQYLVDPRYQHHDAALALSDALISYLQRLLRERIAGDPAKPLDEQIARKQAPPGSAP